MISPYIMISPRCLDIFNHSTSYISAVSLPFLQGPPRAVELWQLPPLQDHHPVATEPLQHEEAPWKRQHKPSWSQLLHWLHWKNLGCTLLMQKKIRKKIHKDWFTSNHLGLKIKLAMISSQEMHGSDNALFTPMRITAPEDWFLKARNKTFQATPEDSSRNGFGSDP